MKESDLKSIKDQLFDLLGPTATSLLPLLGPYGVAPSALISTYLSYRQKRQINNLNATIKELERRSSLVEDIKVNPKRYLPLLEILFDYAVDEVQAEKINYLVNGIETAGATDSLQEDILLSFYDSLRDLRFADIALLRLKYTNKYTVTREEIEETGLTFEQSQAIWEKLVRLGILEDTLEESIRGIYEYIRSRNQAMALAIQFRGARSPIRGLAYDNNLRRQISDYGKQFIEFFMIA